MLVTVLLGTEMTLRLHRLAALRADGTAALDDLLAPTRQRASLGTRAPATYNGGLLGILALRQDLAGDDDDQVAILVVAEPDLTGAEYRFDRRVDLHLLVDIIRRGFGQL